VPKVSTVAEPNVAIVRSADDVAFVGRSTIVHAHVPIDVHTAIDVDTSIDVRASMAAAAVATTVVISSMATTVAFSIRRRHYSKSERRRDRKNERKLLQHFVFLRLRNHVVVLSQKVRERSLNEMRKASRTKCRRSIGSGY
jgi:hypothetical protein